MDILNLIHSYRDYHALQFDVPVDFSEQASKGVVRYTISSKDHQAWSGSGNTCDAALDNLRKLSLEDVKRRLEKLSETYKRL